MHRAAVRNRKTWASVVLVVTALGACVHPSTANEIVFRDEFDSAPLESGWIIQSDEVGDDYLLLRPGYFRINTRRGTLGEEHTVQDMLLREMSGDFILDTRVDFNPTTAQQYAGLLIYVDDSRAVSVGLTFASGDRGVFRGIAMVAVGEGADDDAQRPGGRYDEDSADDPNTVYLRLLRSGDQFVGAFSSDGLVFTDIGTLTNALPDSVLVGLGAANGDFEDCGNACDVSITADFDFFQVTQLETSGSDEPTVEVTLESVELAGPDEVVAEESASFTATARYSDGTASDVTDQAEWSHSPAELGEVNGGDFTAATVEESRQVTVVATFSQLTSGGRINRTGSRVVRITPAASSNGAGPQWPCGFGLLTVLPICMALCVLPRCRKRCPKRAV